MNLNLSRQMLAERFIRYAAVTTQSAEGVPDTPSTACQRELGRLLTAELQEMGASEVFFDEEHCYVYATLPGNIPSRNEAYKKRADAAEKRRENDAPIIGLVAHMDTSCAVSGLEVRPVLIPSYDGQRIMLNQKQNISMGPEEFPDLANHRGQMLVVTDGTSVLGADDKAGIAEIMETFRFYLTNPEYPRGTVRLVFTPDEEVGNGTLWLDQKRFAVDYAFTVDGSAAGELEYENFNAASAEIRIRGISTHPGSAKGIMRNALLVAQEFNSLLPEKETPFYTEGRDGFYHLSSMQGTEDEAVMEYIIRDHDRDLFEKRKETIQKTVEKINEKYGDKVVFSKISDSYYNMIEKIRPHFHLIHTARTAIRQTGLVPREEPIRGGTDGCKLSFQGIPCPNLGDGGYNYHSRYEYAVVDEMLQCVEILVRILNIYVNYELDV